MVRIIAWSLVAVVVVLIAAAAQAGPPSRWSEPSARAPSAKAAEEVGPPLVPVETPGGTVMAPTTSAPPPRAVSPAKSDLPPGWEKPTQLPHDAVTLEQVKPAPVPVAAPAAITEGAPVDEGVIEKPPRKPASRWE